MFYHFLLISLRRFKKDKFFTLLNVLGLSLGIATTVVILSFVTFEYSFDQFHTKKDNIYRVLTHWTSGNRTEKLSVTGTKISNIATNEIPEVVETAKFFPVGSRVPYSLKVEDKVFQESNFAYADPSFLKIFDFNLKSGDPNTALNEPNSIILTEQIANKYFGSTDPMGKTISVNGDTEMLITGILSNPPKNSSLLIGAIASFKRLEGRYGIGWFPMNFMTFIQLQDQTDTDKIADFFLAKAQKDMTGDMAADAAGINFSLQSLSDIHMQKGMAADIGKRGNSKNTIAFLFIGAFILAIACINYINLTTAQSEKKAKEVGIRKVLGSSRQSLVKRYLGETAILTFLSILLAIAFAELALPYINQVIGTEIPFDITNGWFWPTFLFTLFVIITALAGSYPALFLSSFQPVSVLKGTFLSARSGDKFRKILVVFQFSISIFLIIGTIVIYKQVMYGSQKQLGFDQEQIIVVPLADQASFDKLEAIEASLNSHPAIQSTAKVSEVLGNIRAGYGFDAEGLISKENNNCTGFSVDRNGLKTMGLNLIAGSDFTRTSENDSVWHYIVNRQLINDIGWTPEEAIGKDFRMTPLPFGKLIGVVEDFHFASLHEKIGPVVLTYIDHEISNLYVRTTPNQSQAAMDHIFITFNDIVPDSPIEPSFLVSELDELYQSEKRTAYLLILFTGLSIFIGCLGLLGLTAFLVEKKNKEIGIRKIMGASITQIVKNLSWRFISLILIANIIVTPIAFIALNSWLDNYAYTISIGWDIFVITGFCAMAIGFITVFYHSYKAATANPADAIRSE
ncbi:MAG: ABC transporter permease [Reichenbachiella sp.]|uniref:ABC transporter permease n=1 Tax=Reichenbachiella sp. TaxID=2184521 RepID=UPI002966ABF2|nr:ABC transporter permease [Reichenbachiella sp.]MDW3210010.1 ABC transporter permease [Reichenbachiella sp.]